MTPAPCVVFHMVVSGRGPCVSIRASRPPRTQSSLRGVIGRRQHRRKQRRSEVKAACRPLPLAMVAIGTKHRGATAPPVKVKTACTPMPQASASAMVAVGTNNGGATATLPLNNPMVAVGTDDKVANVAMLPATQSCFFGFKVEKEISTGVYGNVFRAVHEASGAKVAIKHMHCKAGGVLTQMQQREVNALRELHNHSNIVKLLQVELVFEYCDTSLRELTRTEALEPDIIVRYTCHLFAGLSFVHSKTIAHRDIKPANLLICQPLNILKLADFGLARQVSAVGDCSLSPTVFTQWYRPPEILLGSEVYGLSSDIWAAELGMFHAVFEALGTPSVAEWPGLAKLPHFRAVPQHPLKPWPKWGFSVGKKYMFLLQGLVVVVPCHRFSAKEASAMSSVLS